MATRGDRLNERLRGAQRVIIDDDDTFGIDIPGIGGAPIVPDEPQAPATQSTPASAKRRRSERSGSRSSQDASPGRRSTRKRPGTSSSLPNVPEEPSPAPSPAPVTAVSTRLRRSSAAATSSPAVAVVQAGIHSGDELDDGDATRNTRPNQSFEDEVEESPRDAPGSGRRRSRILSAPTSELTARLQNVVIASSDGADLSSPLARVAQRKSDASALPPRSARASTRGSSLRRETRPDEDDELSPNQTRDVESGSEAAEIGSAEAARTIGRKRPRRSVSRQSPDIGSEQTQAEVEDAEAEEDSEPPPKKRRARPSKSPVVQKQPTRAKAAAVKAKSTRRASSEASKRVTKAKATKATSKSTDAAPKMRRRRSSAADDNDEVAEPGADDDAAIEITVQRFVNLKKRSGGDDDGEDPLHSEIPFANRSGESTVDVFAQVCEEVINNTMGQFHELLNSSAADAAKKKEFRIKMRAIEAYKEELNSRLLQHTIHLDHWYSLRKRLRHVQKEKLTLREDILKLKAEREQVALRMDAIRTKHEADTKESTYRLDASALMHDIDLAVERGQKAPELTRKEQKEADLANLELLVAQVTEQASSKSASGGLLSQVTEFNAFLERAALALETR